MTVVIDFTVDFIHIFKLAVVVGHIFIGILATCICLENLGPLLILKWAIDVVIVDESFMCPRYKALLIYSLQTFWALSLVFLMILLEE